MDFRISGDRNLEGMALHQPRDEVGRAGIALRVGFELACAAGRIAAQCRLVVDVALDRPAVLIPIVAFLLPADRAAAPGIALYALGLGTMTAAAWASSFPRYRVGLGAVMFAVSDLLIFARLGPLAQSALPGLLIWPLYYFGQFLICTGVIGELRARSA